MEDQTLNIGIELTENELHDGDNCSKELFWRESGEDLQSRRWPFAEALLRQLKNVRNLHW